MTTAERIAAYLKATGWEKVELAKRARVSPSTITRLLHGRKEDGDVEPYRLGELAAMKIERATIEAFTTGATKVPPLRAIDLMSADETFRPTGTG